MSSGSRRVSASFTFFINIVLVISTVVSFAVLIFLSYENLKNRYVNEVVEITEIHSKGTSNSINFMLRSTGISTVDNDYQSTVFTVMNTQNGASGCNLFLVDPDTKEIVHATKYSPETYSIDEAFLKNNISELKDDYKEGLLSDNNILALHCSEVKNLNFYLVAVKCQDNELMIEEFKSIILYPWFIAVVLSIVLCLFFIRLSTRPIREMSRVINKVAVGDYSVRVSKKFTNDNEFANDSLSSDLSDMARTVNYMIDILENQEHDRNIFISSVAHDIRTPLTSINGFVTAMIDGIIPEEMYIKYFDMIKHEVERIRTLVNSMTEASSLSRVEASSMEVFSFRDMVNDVVDGLEPQLNSKYILVVRGYDDTDSLDAYGDAHLLSRVLYNIVSNAIKFTPNGGKIKISAHRDNKAGKLRISVEDSGPGVPEDKRARVFESFYKLDSSRKQEGFGLGLYICKQILVGHNQSIYLDESDSLGGASFRFTFALPREEIARGKQ